MHLAISRIPLYLHTRKCEQESGFRDSKISVNSDEECRREQRVNEVLRFQSNSTDRRSSPLLRRSITAARNSARVPARSAGWQASHASGELGQAMEAISHKHNSHA